MKNEIKGFVDADIWIFKEEIYNGRIAKIWYKEEHARIADYVWKEHGHPVLCNACYFKRTMKTRKIYVKAGEEL
jgi:hypothetical protein